MTGMVIAFPRAAPQPPPDMPSLGRAVTLNDGRRGIINAIRAAGNGSTESIFDIAVKDVEPEIRQMLCDIGCRRLTVTVGAAGFDLEPRP